MASTTARKRVLGLRGHAAAGGNSMKNRVGANAARNLSATIALGTIAAGVYYVIAYLSVDFTYGIEHEKRPILCFILLYTAAFLPYMVAIKVLRRSGEVRHGAAIVLLFAILFRAILLTSAPIQEDDFYRYLWDGAVVANGLNPYKYAPADLKDNGDRDSSRLLYVVLRRSNDQLESAWSRVNHATVPSIYPPVAQVVFAAASLIEPGSLLALRLLLLAFDLAVCLGVMLILTHLRFPPSLCVVYAWSPLVVKETVNSAHFDVVPTFFVVCALFATFKARTVLGFVCLGIAICAKLFPIVFVPFFVCRAIRQNGVTAALRAAGLMCLVIGAIYMPFVDAGNGLWRGSMTFAEKWETNSLLFSVVRLFFAERWSANAAIAIIAVGVILALVLRIKDWSDQNLAWACFVTLGGVLLISPVANPWYFVWIMPFLCLFRSEAWVSLTALLGMYYLNFYFMYSGLSAYVDYVKWFVFLPFFLFLAREVWQVRKGETLIGHG